MILNTLLGGDQQDTESQQGKRSAQQPSPRVLAQQAIEAALAQVAGVPPDPDSGVPPLTPGKPYYAAAKRFAALPAAARHAWLVDHLTALRAGRITLSEIP